MLSPAKDKIAGFLFALLPFNKLEIEHAALFLRLKQYQENGYFSFAGHSSFT